MAREKKPARPRPPEDEAAASEQPTQLTRKPARIILGVSGSIAAYKAADLASRLKKRGHSVTAILTKSACELISPNTFLNLTGNRVFTEMFDAGNGQTEHIRLTDEAELVVIAPATANTIAKLALGLADDMLSTTLLAVRCPVLVCPAMNTRMWEHATVRRNLAMIRALGVRIHEPDAGALACGHVGPGRLAEPESIAAAVEALLLEARSGIAPAEPVRLFLERQTIKRGTPVEDLAAEQRYRSDLAKAGRLAASGTLGVSSEAVHVHRATTLEAARGVALGSPLARSGGATFELAEWHVAGDLGGLFGLPRVTSDPEAPTRTFRLS